MIFVGDVGTNIDLVVTGETITGASAYAMYLRKPISQDVVEVVATTEGTDTIRYVTQSGDIDEAGTWKKQGHITGLTGWSGHTTIAEFEVRPTLND